MDNYTILPLVVIITGLSFGFVLCYFNLKSYCTSSPPSTLMKVIITLKSDYDCSICLDVAKSVRELPCGHQFHDACISEWEKYNLTCPNCRAPNLMALDVALA
jgi:hypothetical protein